MADIQDYMAAARETDTALSDCGLVAERAEAAGDAFALAMACAGRAIALAIREASTRADYLAHVMARGR